MRRLAMLGVVLLAGCGSMRHEVVDTLGGLVGVDTARGVVCYSSQRGSGEISCVKVKP